MNCVKNLSIAIAAILILTLSSSYSPTLDEVGHLPAGCLIITANDFSVYKVNPPLVKTLAAVPVVARDPLYDWSIFDNMPGKRCEWALGGKFISKNGSLSFGYFATARWICLCFWLIGALALARWAKTLHGETASVGSVLLWCFSPEVIAWSATICPDSAAASVGAVAVYSLIYWLREMHLKSTLIAGAACGTALLTKSSWLLVLPPVAIIGMLSRRLPIRKSILRSLTLVVVTLYVVNCGYGFERSFQQLKRFQFFSTVLAKTGPDGQLRSRISPNNAGNRFSGTWLGEIPVPLPASFIEGLDLQKYDFEEGKWSYLRGEHKFGGWWYWYIYALMVKTPVGTILLFFITCGWALWRVEWKSLARSSLQRFARLSRVARLRPGTPRADAPPLAEGNASVSTEPVLHENLILLAPAVCLFVLVSSQTGFSRYLRYVLPCYPFVFIWMSQIFSEKSGLPAWMRKICWGLLAWSVFSSLSVFPHSMSYFNELAGGPENGPAHLIDASIDWGQDVLFLADWVKKHPEAKPLYLSLHVFFDPRVAGIDYEHPPYDPRYARFRQHLTSDRVGPKPGWYAVSVHQLYSRTKEFAYLFDFPKADMVGYSIYLYHLTEQDVENWNRQHAAEIEAASGKPATK